MIVRRSAHEALTESRRLVMHVATVVVWAVVIGFSPGLAIAAAAIALLVADRYDRALLDRLTGQR